MLEWLTELRTFSYVCKFIVKDIIKETDKQPDEEVQRVKSRRVLSAGASVLMELGYTASWPVDKLTHPEAHQILWFRSFIERNLQHVSPFSVVGGLEVPAF